MAHKRVLFRSEARERILGGATSAARITLGPTQSKSVMTQRHWDVPIVRNGGVATARECGFTDAEENHAARMLRQAAGKRGDAIGDGTSAATVRAQAIVADEIRDVVAGAENAVPVACALLVTEAAMTGLPKPKGKQAGLPGKP